MVVGVNRSTSIEALNGTSFNLMGMREDLAPWFEKARVMIAPTRFAAGIPLKVYQAAALGVPIVATTLVAEQAGWQPERELLAASDPTAFAEACVRLHRDKALWTSVRAAAIERCRRDCSPQQFRSSVRQILRAMSNRRALARH
jgi:glycosyltransferase involved in cell wall biosynthesis